MTPSRDPWRPALRAEVEAVAGPEGVAGLRQPRTGHVVRIGRVTRALLPSLDGRHALEEVLAGPGAFAPRADAEDALRALLLLGFVRGAGDEGFARLVALDAATAPVLFLESSRFTCQGSGQCCRIYELGPLDEDDVRRLESLDLARAFHDLGPGPHVRRDERGGITLARRDERCVFLLPDERCGLHAAFGADAKPKLCRLYPFRAQLTSRGLRIVDQSECATFATSARSGEPIAAQLDRIRALLPASPEVHHPLVLLDAQTPCDHGWVLALEGHLLPLFEDAGVSAGEALRAVSRRALAFAEALAACPLAPGEPDATVAAALGAPLLALRAPPPPAAEGLAALAVVARSLLATIEERGLAEPVIPRLRVALEALAAGQAAVEPGELADPGHAGLVLRASLRNAVFAGRLLCEGRLRAGLLRLALVPLLTLVGARALARGRAVARGGDRELSEAHVAASVGLRMPSLQRTLVAVEAHAVPVVEAAASLVARAAPGRGP